MLRMTVAAAAALAIAWIAFALIGRGAATGAARPVAPQVIQGAEGAVLKVRCSNVNVAAGVLSAAIGTGFVTSGGTVTAAHVISTCADSGPGSISAGPLVGSVSADDPADDLALIGARPAGTTPLPLQVALPSNGARVELLGSPGLSSGAAAQPVSGTVIATNAPVTLFGAEGNSERLTDTIVVDENGVAEGYSGGPAINAAGQVIGVIEGAGDGHAYLTPAADVASLLG